MKETKIEEVWKDIPGYNGLYKVSNTGKVKSMYFHSQKGKGNNIKENPKILNPGIDSYGYSIVSLCDGNTKKTMAVHKIVAKTFIPNPYNFPCINHKDENKQNNSVENLEWCTVKYNNSYGTKGRRTSNTLKKKVFQYDKQMNLIKVYNGAIDAEKETGISRSNICTCIKGRIKIAGGFIWKDKLIEKIREDNNGR